jgi:RecA/RadA recombinase
MPTVSAAQALQDLKSSPTRCVSTGLALLDTVLQNMKPGISDGEPLYGGVSRGKVTEVYGPPGVGKTTLGLVILRSSSSNADNYNSMQLAASALHAGEGVLWVGK